MKEQTNLFKILLGLTFALLLGIPVLSVGENPLTVSPVQDDLYLINGMEWDINVSFLVTGEGVLVVDSGNDTADGRRIVEKIKEKTDKPIKYVVLTHHHGDHAFGLMGFPKDVTVIAHDNCAQNFPKFSEDEFKWYLEKGLPEKILELQQEIEKLKKEPGQDIEKKEKELKKTEQQLEDFKNGHLVYPSITFSEKLTLRLGKEKIEILYPGCAHTNGDALVYIPGRKVIMMGDLLFYGYIPFIDWQAGSDTRNWIGWMEKLSQWDLEKVIPGHGVVTDKTAFEQQKRYLTDLRASVQEGIAKGLSLEEMVNSIKMTGYRQWKFYDFVPSNIEAVYHELKKAE